MPPVIPLDQAGPCDSGNPYGNSRKIFFTAVGCAGGMIIFLIIICYLSISLFKANKKCKRLKHEERLELAERKVSLSENTVNNLSSTIAHNEAEAVESRLEAEKLQEQLLKERTEMSRLASFRDALVSKMPKIQSNKKAATTAQPVAGAPEDTQQRNSGSSVSGILVNTPFAIPSHQPNNQHMESPRKSIESEAIATRDRAVQEEENAAAKAVHDKLHKPTDSQATAAADSGARQSIELPVRRVNTEGSDWTPVRNGAEVALHSDISPFELEAVDGNVLKGSAF
ncbi:hypothetical protein F53441_6704 [Fusarium austroafricanum]|uniref:Uncharacterized protein n=1 Tax=Fusarium austroafricanum TaxID=2364996 RepID=A0A8H4NW92_9HYPO|nr:hypothetical protein F53441_6704 [Fusarium austroafricanum]